MTQSVDEYNRSHALTKLNGSVSVFVWVLGFGTLVSTFIPVTLPWLGTLPGGLGLNHAIDNLIAQGGLLLLFVNTNNVYEYYVVQLRYSLSCALTGSAVYLAHLCAVVVCFRNPALWLWCIAGILALRAIANLQVYQCIKKELDHPWKETLRVWCKHSFLYLSIIVVCALVVKILSDVRLYAWVHRIPVAELAQNDLSGMFIKDIQTLLFLVVAFQIGRRAFQHIGIRPKFTKEQVDQHNKDLKSYYESLSSSE